MMKALLTATGSILALQSSLMANAQSEDEPEFVQKKVIVSAAKRSQSLQDVPIAVSVVGQETIEKAQMTDLFDLQSVVPSLRVEQLQTAASTNFQIRGFGNGANNPGIEGSVGVFIDGVYRSRSASAILDLPTLERVEVLRGPQSILFGKNVSAGAISITTQKPTFDTSGSAEATLGNYNQVGVKGTFSTGLTDTLALRLSGSSQKRDGFITNTVDGSDINERDRWAVRGQLLWEPNDAWSWRLITDYNKIDEICCGAVQIDNDPAAAIPFVVQNVLGGTIVPDTDPFAREVAMDVKPINQLEGWGASLHGDWDIGFADVTSITSYREQTNLSNTDADFSSADIANQVQDLDIETFTQEIRLTSKSEGPLDWQVGVFYSNEDVAFGTDIVNGADARELFDVLIGGTLAQGEGGTLLAFALTTDPATAIFPELAPIIPVPVGSGLVEGQGNFADFTLKNESVSVFANFDYDISDRLTLSGGISYIDDSKDASGVNLTEPIASTDFVSAGQSFLAASALAGAIPDAFGGPVAFDPSNLTPFFAGVAQFQAAAPDDFAAARAAAVQFATDPANAAINPLAPFTAVQFVSPFVAFPDPTNPLDDGKLDSDNVDYSLRLAYDVSDSINTYITYATGFKAGSFDFSTSTQPPTPLTGIGRTAAPEKVELIEAGLKASFAQGSVNIAVFEQTIKDFQEILFTGTSFDLTNAGEQRTRGIELESVYQPLEQLSLAFNISYLDPEFVDFSGAGCVAQDLINCANGELFRDLSGTQVGGVHEISLSTSGIYEFAVSEAVDGFVRLEYRHDSDVPVTNLVPQFTREVNIINGSLGFEHENGWDVLLWARNLTDNEFYIEDFSIPLQGNSLFAYPSAPRTYGVTARKRF